MNREFKVPLVLTVYQEKKAIRYASVMLVTGHDSMKSGQHYMYTQGQITIQWLRKLIQPRYPVDSDV